MNGPSSFLRKPVWIAVNSILCKFYRKNFSGKVFITGSFLRQKIYLFSENYGNRNIYLGNISEKR